MAERQIGQRVGVEADAAETQTLNAEQGKCFLCPFGDHPCDIPSVEGRLRSVALRYGSANLPAVLLDTADGAVAIVLPDHTKPLIARLVELPPAVLHALHARVVHLLGGLDHETPAPDGTTRRLLRATPISALVLEPDLLLNITDINNAEYCVRQYPLRRLVPSPPTSATLRGTIIHSAFKDLLKGEPDTLDGYLGRAIANQAADIALRQLDADQIVADAAPHLRALDAWRDRQQQSLWGGAFQARAETFLLAPEVGLKGRLDFLIQEEMGGSLLELKTSTVRPGADLPRREHRWQVYGYQTLLAARHPHDRKRPGATLLYSGSPGQAEDYGIRFALREMHRVLDLRNQLALTHVTGLVPPPPSPGKCAKCAIRRDCLRASPLLDWEAPASDEPPAPVDPADAAWFRETYALLQLEARASEAEATALWRFTAEERRAAGVALGGLAPLGDPLSTASGEWEYSFSCENTSELREGDAILLSDGDPVRGEVVTGTILHLDQHGVTVWTPERITRPALIDRYSSDIVHDRTVRNLWRWLAADPHQRALVAGREPPTFTTPIPSLPDLPSSFNDEQREAVEKALAARDFLLVQGPPGTGKTSVVAEIARRAVARGERVLVAAFTNQAVDNVLRRLVTDGFTDFVRLGHELSVAPELRDYRLANRAHAIPPDNDEAPPIHPTTDDPAADASITPQRLRRALLAAPLVGATTATWSAERYDDAGEPLRFDLAIVDEASQLTVPSLLGALRFARRFVLVGDERQLPPLVVSEEAATQGLRQSIFTRLIERWGDSASVALRRQYRMHPLICAFPSAEFYNGRLVAKGAARTALLDLPHAPRDPLWPVLNPERPVVFINVAETTDAAAAKVSRAQADVVCKTILALRRAGLAANEIGAIAPYRAQVAIIRQRLATHGETDVLVDTVDRFQGGERRAIIFSFGGRITQGLYGRGADFLADPHRLNVALTRAQRKLILVGDRRWLTEIPLLARLIQSCQNLYDGAGGIVNARLGS